MSIYMECAWECGIKIKWEFERGDLSMQGRNIALYTSSIRLVTLVSERHHGSAEGVYDEGAD
jgi:hypothetical protein